MINLFKNYISKKSLLKRIEVLEHDNSNLKASYSKLRLEHDNLKLEHDSLKKYNEEMINEVNKIYDYTPNSKKEDKNQKKEQNDYIDSLNSVFSWKDE